MTEMEDKVRELGEKLTALIEAYVNVHNYGVIESKMKEINDIFSQNRPLATGKILMELASLLQEITPKDIQKIDPPKDHRDIIKACYILAFELAIEKLTERTKEIEESKRKVKEEFLHR
jgi:hypothetical protein